MRCLVTGGAGFIGSHLVDKLVSENHKVIVMDNLSTGKKENIQQHLENDAIDFHEVDISDERQIIATFEHYNFDVVFHVAALPRIKFSIDQPVESRKANVDGTFNLLELASQFNVRRFVYSSSSSVYGDQKKLPLTENIQLHPKSPYATQKLIGELAATSSNRTFGLETVSLRYFNVYGPRQDPEGGYACLIPRTIARVIKGERPIITDDGEQSRDFTYIDDVVAANIQAALTQNEECFGQVFNIGANRSLSVNNVVSSIVTLSGRRVNPIYEPKREGETRHTLADITRSREILGWSPGIHFEEGLERTFYSERERLSYEATKPNSS